MFTIAASLALIACGRAAEPRNGADSTARRDTAAAATAHDPVPAKPALKKGEIWKGTSGGMQITWSSGDITAEQSGSPIFSLHQYAVQGLHRAIDTLGGAEDWKGCSDEQVASLVSVVGSLASIERNEEIVCPNTAHPSLVTWYDVIDLAHPDRTISLADFFRKEDLFNALMADAVVKKTLASDGGAMPRTLDDLVKRLAGSLGECEYSFTDDMLTHFAFHHIEDGKVAVRIGLSHGAEACRGMLTQIGILLPIPSSLSAALGKASRGEEGFMGGDAKKIAHDGTTSMKLL